MTYVWDAIGIMLIDLWCDRRKQLNYIRSISIPDYHSGDIPEGQVFVS